MINFIVNLVLISLLFPGGFNFLISQSESYSYAYPAPQIDGPNRIINNSLGIVTTAKSVLAVDDKSGQILFAKNRHISSPIASITKLMTVLVFLDNNPGWDQEIVLFREDKKEGGKIYLMTGEKVTVKNLFNLTLVASSNEAAAALARSTGLDDFVAKMNIKAEELGMVGAEFFDATGLDSRNIASPTDLVKLTKVCFENQEILAATTSSAYDFPVLNNGRLVKAENTDKLLDSFLNSDDYEILAAKTGYLDESGYCLVIKIKKIGQASITLVLLGSNSQSDRWQEAKGVIDWVFGNYQWAEN